MTRRHPHETIKLPNWLRWSIYGVTLLLTLTGILWLTVHYWPHRTTQEFDAPNPLEPWLMRLHGFAVMPALFLYGSLLRSHMLKAWHARMNRNSGLWTVIILAWLIITGYLLYYAGSERIRFMISCAHWSIGIFLAAILPLHIWIGRNPRRRAKKRRNAIAS
ncbi:MAG TPA: hypothetical protein VFT64_07650 [Rickettsiales bacterium]|nr:hypothetical protein [Rickettsiales bacterium]